MRRRKNVETKLDLNTEIGPEVFFEATGNRPFGQVQFTKAIA